MVYKKFDFSAMGSDDGFLGINGCILTYSPQIFRYSFDGQLIHDDFCITKVTAKAGTSVSFISKPHKIKKFIFAQFQVKSELCKPGNKNQIWDRIRPPNNGIGGYFFKNREILTKIGQNSHEFVRNKTENYFQ